MLNIPEEVKTLFSTDGVNKNFHVHFPNGETSDLNNENILSESVQFTESLCSQQYFKFGLAEASQIEFTAVGIPNILGAVIDCAMEIDCTSLGSAWAEQNPIDTTLDFLEPQTCEYNSKIYYRIPYGRFIVDSCPRNHGAMAQRKITAYSETPFSNKQLASGSFPYSKIELSPSSWIKGNSLQNDEMIELDIGARTAQFRITDGVLLTSSGGNKSLDSFTGILFKKASSKRFMVFSSPTYPPDPSAYTWPRCIVAVRLEYEKSEFDDYSVKLTNAAMNSAPSEAYVYRDGSATSSPVLVKEFKNTKQALTAMTGAFAPCFYIKTVYSDSAGSKASRYSKPIFPEPGVTYFIDLRDPEMFQQQSFYVSAFKSGSFGLYESTIEFLVPYQWNNTAQWDGTNASGYSVNYPISNWGTIAPFNGQTSVIRSGNIKAYYQYIAHETDVVDIIIQNTLKYKNGALGNYYTFANAISTLGIVEGLMELTGEFWKIYRTGVHNFFKISENQTLILVSRSDWEEFWWDENDVDPIGTVNAKFSDDENSGEESIMTFSIGDGASIYTMEDNAVLENTTATQDELQTVIDTYFAPNAEVINFTPVDLTMRGLPYLEAGDYIQLTAEDGTTVNTYILEQTINGIQHLTADITSTNGELLEVMENE